MSIKPNDPHLKKNDKVINVLHLRVNQIAFRIQLILILEVRNRRLIS